MGRWDDWIAIEAAMEKQQAEDVERRAVRARRKALRVVTPEDTALEPVEAAEAVLARPEESPPVTKPRDWRAASAARAREALDPIAALRLVARDWLDRLGRDE